MRFFKNLFIGLNAYWKAILFIRKHKLYWYMLIPAVFMLFIYKLGNVIQYRQTTMHTETMNEIVWGLIQMLFEILLGLTLMKFSKYLVVILLSPLLSFLSQKSEKILTGNSYEFNILQLYHDIKRGIRIALRNLIWHYFFFAIIFTVSVLGWEDPKESPVFYLTFVIGFFYYGFSFLDYVNERLRMDMHESIAFARNHRGLAISIGMVYSLMILVPVDLDILFTGKSFHHGILNGVMLYLYHLILWLCAASAPILAIVAATLSMHDVVNLKSNRYSKK